MSRTLRAHRPGLWLPLTAAILVTFQARAEPRIVSAMPTDQGWQLVLEGIDSPAFALDGNTVAATRCVETATGIAWDVATGAFRGGRLPVLSDEQVLVMRKRHPEGNVLAAVNLSDAERVVHLDAADAAGAGQSWQAVPGSTAPMPRPDGSVSWTLPPLSTSLAHRDPLQPPASRARIRPGPSASHR